MEYRTGRMGRVFYVRFDHGDDLLEGLQALVLKEEIHCAWFELFGGQRRTSVVVGPEEPVMPPSPVWRQLDDVRELCGIGSVFRDRGEPLVHLHGALGHRGETITGCIRERAEVYLVVEAVVYELLDMEISRPLFDRGGFHRPEFGRRDQE